MVMETQALLRQILDNSMQYRKAEYTKSLPFIVHTSTRMEVR